MRHAGEGSCRKSKPTSRRGRSLLTRAKGKAGGGGGGRGSEDFKKRASSTAWEGQRQRPSPTYACSSTVFVSRPLGEARNGRAREDGHWQYCENGLFRCLSRLASEPATTGRRGCPQLWSFPAPLLVSEGSHPALAARGCKMLLPGFSTTLCPAPSLLPPNIPDVRSTGAWIGGVSRDTERPPARSLPVAGPCQLPALTTFHSCGFRGTIAVSKMAATSRPPAPKPNQHQQQGPAGQVPGSSKDGNCLALGLECPESTSPLPLPRTLHACQFV